MKTSFVSTPAFANALRTSMRQSQADLFIAQKELASGRYADVGLTLGNRTGLTVTLRQQFEQLRSITQTNDVVSARMEATQVALSSMIESADAFLQSLISGRDTNEGAPVLRREAAQSLEALIDGLNVVLGGQNLFAGINTEQQPLVNYFDTPAPASKAAVDAAFLGAFGFNQNDPNVETITPANMQNFLDNDFAPLFEEPQWIGTWSAASSTLVESRISTSETLLTSASANEGAIRTLAEAFTMVADLGVEGLSESTYQTLVDGAIKKVGVALEGLTAIKARLGTVQARVDGANDRMTLQIDILATRIMGLENIDPYEASTRVSELTSQVEIAFALTARMQRLGILQFL